MSAASMRNLVVWFAVTAWLNLLLHEARADDPQGKPRTVLAIDGSRFTINGRATFLLGISDYGVLGATDEQIRHDLDDMQNHGFNWLRLWANWAAFENDVSAVDVEGKPREVFLKKLVSLVAECDRRGLIVDVSLSRGNGASGPPRLQSLEAHRRAVETLVAALKPFRNWYLDLSNERNIKDKRHTAFDELKSLRESVRTLDPHRLVTASHAGDISLDELREYMKTVHVDFLSPHRPRHAQSPGQTDAKTRAYLADTKALGRFVPVHYQEPFRRGYQAGKDWEPSADDFLTDLRQARSGGAAGWCFHNGDQRNAKDGRPRRSFDLRDGRLFAQLDAEESKVIQAIAAQEKKQATNIDSARLRLIVETDAGGDPDDEQSLVRFLLYASEWDVEGIIANRPAIIRRENFSHKNTGLEIVRQFLDAYAEVYPRLKEHDDRFPSPQTLRERTVPGYNDTDDGLNLIIGAVDRDDPRPVWFLNWGTNEGSGVSSLRRALDQVLKERGPEGYAKFKNRILLSSDDQFGDHTTKIDPPWRLWVYPFYPTMDGGRWYHRFSPITMKAGGFDIRRDLLTGHGPLGALYPTNTHLPQKEGDSYTFLYLIPTGMNDPFQPTWGSWAGRFGVRENWKPLNPNFYWANQRDTLDGTTHRDNTLKRWAADLQNDFRARLDWCVKPRGEANHPPRPVLDGDKSGQVIVRDAPVGSTIRLSAAGSSDLDGDKLTHNWSVYREAGTYAGHIELRDAAAEEIDLRIPDDAAGKTIHVLLTVRDAGNPPLARYRRVVLRGTVAP